MKRIYLNAAGFVIGLLLGGSIVFIWGIQSWLKSGTL